MLVETDFGEPIEPVRFAAGDLDPASSPRDDLDAFVNARWRAAHPLPAHDSVHDCFSILREHSQRVQAHIAAEAAAAPIRSEAARVVGDLWASGLGDDARETETVLRGELARIAALDSAAAIAAYLCERHARGWPLLFSFEVSPAFDDPRAMLACISPGGLGLPDRDCYLDDDSAPLRDAYVAHVTAILDWSGFASAQELAARVLAFETRLAAASLSRRAIARDVSLRQARVTLADIEPASGAFAWRAFFAAHGIAAPAQFSLAPRAFHAEWQAMLGDVAPAVWRAYFAFHTIDGFAAAAGGRLGAIHHAFHGVRMRGIAQPAPRWKRVLAVLNADIGEALGELYVGRAFPPQALHAAERLVAQVRAAFDARIEALDWLSAAGKALARRKLAAMRCKIGHPRQWRDWSRLRTSRSGWAGNLLAARAFERTYRIAQLAAPLDADAWTLTPQTVNAGYDPQRNEIVFPAAILQPPFFDAGADAALNYGGIGAVIAHEMTHGFDDQGSRFGADGRFEDSWDGADRARFAALAERLVLAFEQSPRAGDFSVDGRLTLGENIADFGGLAIAFDALCAELAHSDAPDPRHDGYDQRQRFFLAWATIWRQCMTPQERLRRARLDTHAPAALRANEAAAHLDAFAAAFGVGAGDAMYRAPAERIRIW